MAAAVRKGAGVEIEEAAERSVKIRRWRRVRVVLRVAIFRAEKSINLCLLSVFWYMIEKSEYACICRSLSKVFR
jgi:hypothetical protein